MLSGGSSVALEPNLLRPIFIYLMITPITNKTMTPVDRLVWQTVDGNFSYEHVWPTLWSRCGMMTQKASNTSIN